MPGKVLSPGSIVPIRDEPDSADYLDEVAQIFQRLNGLGLEPVLVGGMALVILGSRRVTRDFDFTVSQPADALEEVLDTFYDRGLELVARLDDTGDVVVTIGNRRVASARIRLDAPASVSFFSRRTGLRIDLLFDFPIPAATLAKRARQIKVRSHTLRVASERDLLRLKKIAQARRSSPGDTEDIAFLEGRLRK
jgi:hypothetical protein